MYSDVFIIKISTKNATLMS